MLSHRNPDPQKPGRVLILGARGFISRHLQNWCAAQGIDCLPVGSNEIDLTDTANAPRLARLVQPGDAVVMGSILTPDKGRDYAALMRNLRMAETVCLALERSPCAHFVYLSSDAVYDAHQIPLDEDSTREPTDMYALAHIAREMMLGTLLNAKGIPLCILRLTAIYGPGDTHSSYGPNRFTRSALKDGRIELFGRGEEHRSHVYIEDAVKLIGLALLHQSAGTLNVAICPTVSFMTVAKQVIRLTSKPVRIEYLPRTVPITHRPYKHTQLFRFIYNLGRPIGQVVHRTFVNKALFDAFPHFRFTSLEDGIRMSIRAESSSAEAES